MMNFALSLNTVGNYVSTIYSKNYHLHTLHCPRPKPNHLFQSLHRHLFPFVAKNETDFRRHIEILKEYYYFKRLPNDYIRRRKRLPKEPLELKLKKYFFPVTDLTTVQKLITEIEDDYYIPEPLPTEYTEINFTNKPELPWDFRKIQQIKLNIPITDPRELVSTAR